VGTQGIVSAVLLSLALAAPASAASGAWERSWGKDILSGGSNEFEVCTVASSCKAGGAGVQGGDLSSPYGIAVGPDGSVYVADASNQRIDKFGPAGRWMRSWGADVVAGGGTGFEICTEATSCKGGVSYGPGGGFNSPVGVAVDPSGNVYVVDSQMHRVQKFDSAGNFEAAWGKNVVAGGGTGYEVCTVAANCQGGEEGGLGGELRNPDGIATDGAGNVYVSDYANDRIQKFDPAGEFKATWGRGVVSGGTNEFEICTVAEDCHAGNAGGKGGELDHPVGLAVAGTTVYVGDSFSSRVQAFSTAGVWRRAWGKDVDSGGSTGFEVCATASSCKVGAPASAGEGGGFAGGPYGMAVDEAGNVYTADANNDRIQVFTGETGAFKSAWGKNTITGGATGYEICTAIAECQAGEAGGLGGEMSLPFALAGDGAGNLYLGDRGNVRVDRFSDSGPPSEEEGGGKEGGGNEEKGGGGGGNADRTAPKLSASRGGKQRLGKLAITVHSDEAGTLKGFARVTGAGAKPARSKPAAARIGAGKTVVLHFRFARKARGAILRALRSGKHPKAKISVTATDAAGNSSTLGVSVKLLR
jgi:sugar lactone lactonase YvrE